MPEIRQLSASVINKIAAGEVIERPASVVKELLENAVDAGAMRIDVTVAGGGSDLIRIADNGCGISAEQLPLAVSSHATSKINEADDLFRIGTLGFRGEALASIAEVSRMTIRSRPADEVSGAELVINGGQRSPVEPCGCGVGTVIEVRDLFFNTPVRRKFLRTTQTEFSHVSEAVTRIALAWPNVHFTLKHKERLVTELPAAADWRPRIAALFDEDLAASLIEIEGSSEEVALSGFVAPPHHSRSHARMQYLLVNGRFIKDRALSHALGEAYRGLLIHGRYPVAFLQMQLPPDQIDVNVHPTKLEVRFQDSGRLYSQLLGTLRSRFLTTDLTALVGSNIDRAADSDAASEPTGHDADAAAARRQELVDWARTATAGNGSPTNGEITSGVAAPGGPTHDAGNGSLNFRYDEESRPALEVNQLNRVWPAANGHAGVPHRPDGVAAVGEAGDQNETTDPLASSGTVGEFSGEFPAQVVAAAVRTGHGQPAMQVQDRYLITENENGVVIIDQHALHERILYEQLRDKAAKGTLEVQKLLVPEPVTLAPAEAARVLESQETLGQLGIEVSEFGGDTVLITAYPAMLANLNPGKLLQEVTEQLLHGDQQADSGDVFDDLLHMVACKAAIKAGDRLAPEEVTALIELGESCRDAHHCPHGRPTSLVFTREELDRRFQRT